MTLGPRHQRRAYDLVSIVDLLWRRFLARLEEPFALNLEELRQWRERVIQIQELWDKTQQQAHSLLVAPQEWLDRIERGGSPFLIYWQQWELEEARAEAEEEAFRKWQANPEAYAAQAASDAAASAEGEGDGDLSDNADSESNEAEAEPEPEPKPAPRAASRDDGRRTWWMEPEPEDAQEDAPEASASSNAAANAESGEPAASLVNQSRDERIERYRATHSELIDALQSACALLTEWARVEPQRFR